MEGMDYHLAVNNGRMNGGIMQITEQMGDMPPTWTVYFAVADIDATVEKAKALGGNVLMPITDAGEVGRFTLIADPAGAVSSFIQGNNPDPWIE